MKRKQAQNDSGNKVTKRAPLGSIDGDPADAGGTLTKGKLIPTPESRLTVDAGSVSAPQIIDESTTADSVDPDNSIDEESNNGAKGGMADRTDRSLLQSVHANSVATISTINDKRGKAIVKAHQRIDEIAEVVNTLSTKVAKVEGLLEAYHITVDSHYWQTKYALIETRKAIFKLNNICDLRHEITNRKYDEDRNAAINHWIDNVVTKEWKDSVTMSDKN